MDLASAQKREMPFKTEKTEHSRKESVPFFLLKEHQLLHFLSVFLLLRIPQQDLYVFILPLGDYQHSHSPARGQRFIKPVFMYLNRVHSTANSGIDRELHHIVSVCQQEISKAGSRCPLRFCFYRQVKKYQNPHKLIHNDIPAGARVPEAPNLSPACAGCEQSYQSYGLRQKSLYISFCPEKSGNCSN